MSPTDPRSEETLFAAALELPEAARAAYLEQACGGDAALRGSVEALLRANLAATGFLPSAVGVAQPTAEGAAPVAEQPGDWIGRYKLLQKIGEGGCGIVYMAEQEEPVRRRVALKVVKLGMDTKAVVARFAAERQALAMMDHPNIAKVLDAGATDSGRPFFVMELVRGIPVTRYCDEQGLATEQRLELFSQICLAIQHAHQKGIIHRDIKPSNILVTLHDGAPMPKVIDFGIAKATQGRLTDETYFTAFEQFIGTPAYMSPEQAEMSGLDVDTRSDVYSLGVLLYELLVGRPPFDPKSLSSAGLDEMRRIIREVEPPKPSTRLSTLAEADRTVVARRRGAAPAQLSTVLAGDLDWIVMRCLEKDRARRYATPSELVADIQRYLRNEPVIARPPTTGYLLRKLTRRHKLGFAAGAAVAVSLIAGLLAASALLVREHAARERARAAAAKSEQVAGFMKEMVKGIDPRVALGRDAKALLPEILDATARRLETELRDQPAVAADLRDTLGDVYLATGQNAAAEQLLRAAVAAHRAVSGNLSAETAASLNLLGQALRRLNKSAEAEAALQEALSIRRRLFGDRHPSVADTLAELAWVANAQRSLADRRVMLEEVLAIRRQAFGNEHSEVATALYELGLEAARELDHIKAARLHEQALAMRRRLLGNDHPDVAASLDALGFSYAHELDRKNDAAAVYQESFSIRRKVLGDAHPDTAISLLRFAGQRPAREVPPETLATVREFVANQRRLTPASPLLGPTLLALASLEDLPDRNPAEAQTLIREARALLEQARATSVATEVPDDGVVLAPGQARARSLPIEAEVIDAMMFFAWSKFVANAPGEGLIMGEESVKLARAAFAGTPWRMLPTHTLAWCYVGLRRSDDAAKLFEVVIPLYRKAFREDFPITLVDVAALGICYCATDRVADAHQYLAAALASVESKPGIGGINPHIAIVQCQFGLTLLREGRFVQAEAMLRQALKGYGNPDLKPLPLRLHPRQRALSGLGQALAGQGKFAEAEPLVVQGYQELQANENRIAGDRAGMIREALDAVVALYTAWGKPDKVAEWQAKRVEPEARPARAAELSADKT